MIDPIPNEPILATQQWREVVTRARLRCECRGQCASKHDKDRMDPQRGRCQLDLVLGDGKTPRPGAKLLVREVMPDRFVAVCEPCFAGLDRIENRQKRKAAAGPPQEEVLF